MNLIIDLIQVRIPKHYEFLVFGLLMSLCIHTGIFFIKIKDNFIPNINHAENLEIILVNTETKFPPLEPKFIAQSNLIGGGDNSDFKLSTSPIPKTSDNNADIVLAQLIEHQKELENRQQELLISLKSQINTDNPQQQAESFIQGQSSGEDTINQQSLIISAQIAALEEKIQKYNAQPKQQFVGPSAKSDVLAKYLEDWRHQIELLGTQHYPEQARGKIYGSLQLTVYINYDGSLQRIEIDKPSQHAILNLAAQRIVQLAAPFAPLPQEISKDTDILAITRTWHFQNQQLKTNVP